MERILSEWNVEEITKGVRQGKDGNYVCAQCGTVFESGQVYPMDGRFYDAEHAAQQHAARHGSLFERLLSMDKKVTGLTENQAQLMRLMRAGHSDSEIARELNVAASTVRHQRFVFREKARQAKAYLALFAMSVERGTPAADAPVPVHANARMVDERYNTTQSEQEKILSDLFESSGGQLTLRIIPRREKSKIVVLRRIAQEFESEKTYTEKEVNDILRGIYSDFATLRRYLIEYGFMQRSADCREYRRSDGGTAHE